MSEDYAVCVTFRVRPERLDTFLVFDIWAGGEDAGSVFLYEIYRGRTAFEAHLRTPHFEAFDRMVADMVVSKDASTWEMRK